MLFTMLGEPQSDVFCSVVVNRAGRQDPTEVGAALEGLHIMAICATPRAKGRVEWLFEMLQDWLAPLLARDGIANMPAGNAYVGNGFLESFDRRFAQAPHCPEQAAIGTHVVSSPGETSFIRYSHARDHLITT